MNPNRVDMTLERSPKQWSDLLHAVKVNNDNIYLVYKVLEIEKGLK